MFKIRTALALSIVTLAITLIFPAMSRASGSHESELRYENGHFVPQHLTVPANQPVRIKVVNTARDPIEFESFDLNRERVVPPGGQIIVYLPSLSAGSYGFYNDFNRSGTQGTLVAK